MGAQADDLSCKRGVDGVIESSRFKCSAFNSRRAGSSWNRGKSSAWNVGGKVDAQRVKSTPVRNYASSSEAYPSGNSGELFCASERESSSNEDVFNTSFVGSRTVRLEVKKERGCFKADGSVETAVDADTLYGIITDFNSNARVFRNVDRVQVDGKGNEKLVTQFLHWNFLMWSGTYDIRMKIKNNPEHRSVSYELAQPGFLKIFKGSWTVEPLASEGVSLNSKLVLKQHALPSHFPAGPLAVGAQSYASKIMTNQIANLLTDVAVEAHEVKKRADANAWRQGV